MLVRVGSNVKMHKVSLVQDQFSHVTSCDSRLIFLGNSGLVPEAYVELSNDPPPPAPTPNTQFSNDDSHANDYFLITMKILSLV